VARLAVTRIRSENPAPIGQRARIDLIRELLTREDYPLVERVVSMLVLLYVQPVTRIVQLKVDDVLVDADGVSIRLGDPPSPVPGPFADLLLQLLCNPPSMSMPTNLTSPWLLLGRRPGNPMTGATIRKRIISAGVPNVFARTAALRPLVLEAPAPVVAGMLGFHPVHTAFVTKQAAPIGAGTHPATAHETLTDAARNLDKNPASPPFADRPGLETLTDTLHFADQGLDQDRVLPEQVTDRPERRSRAASTVTGQPCDGAFDSGPAEHVHEREVVDGRRDRRPVVSASRIEHELRH